MKSEADIFIIVPPSVPHTGEEHVYCQALIEAHKACLRVEGFNVGMTCDCLCVAVSSLTLLSGISPFRFDLVLIASFYVFRWRKGVLKLR